jgi:hypothetical protein
MAAQKAVEELSAKGLMMLYRDHELVTVKVT